MGQRHSNDSGRAFSVSLWNRHDTGCQAAVAVEVLWSYRREGEAPGGVSEAGDVEPADSAGPASRGAVLPASFAQVLRQLTNDLCRVRPCSNPRRVRLGLQM